MYCIVRSIDDTDTDIVDLLARRSMEDALKMMREKKQLFSHIRTATDMPVMPNKAGAGLGGGPAWVMVTHGLDQMGHLGCLPGRWPRLGGRDLGHGTGRLPIWLTSLRKSFLKPT